MIAMIHHGFVLQVKKEFQMYAVFPPTNTVQSGVLHCIAYVVFLHGWHDGELFKPAEGL